MRDLPAGLVVVEVAQSGGGLMTDQIGPDTRFPLSLDSAKKVDDTNVEPGEPYGAPQPRLYIEVSVGDEFHVAHLYVIDVWFGGRARPNDRKIARLVVASIRMGPQTPYYSPEPYSSPTP